MRITLSGVLLGATLSLTAGLSTASAGPIVYGPSPYGGAADSPFSAFSYSQFWLEDFEDGLNLPGVAASGGLLIGNDPYIDSVEGGAAGRSWYSNGLHSLMFTFDPAGLGSLPTDVGLVWTDIGYNAPTPYFGQVFLEAFGPGGVSLGILTSFLFGDGMDTGQKAEDRFMGLSYASGISAIRFGTDNGDWEVDHLQFGMRSPVSVAEPSTLLLFGIGAAGMTAFRRRRVPAGR